MQNSTFLLSVKPAAIRNGLPSEMFIDPAPNQPLQERIVEVPQNPEPDVYQVDPAQEMLLQGYARNAKVNKAQLGRLYEAGIKPETVLLKHFPDYDNWKALQAYLVRGVGKFGLVFAGSLIREHQAMTEAKRQQ